MTDTPGAGDTHGTGEAHEAAEGAARLVAMANQIATFFRTQQGNDAAEDIANHLRRYWEPRMRAAILAHLDAGGAGLEPEARAAVTLLRQQAVPRQAARAD